MPLFTTFKYYGSVLSKFHEQIMETTVSHRSEFKARKRLPNYWHEMFVKFLGKSLMYLVTKKRLPRQKNEDKILDFKFDNIYALTLKLKSFDNLISFLI